MREPLIPRIAVRLRKVPVFGDLLSTVKRQVLRLPVIGKVIRQTPFAWWYLWALVRGRRPGTLRTDLRPRWVDPDLIREVYLGGPRDPLDLGAVVGGDWDLTTVPFEELEVVRAFRRHFEDDVPWDDLSWVRTMRTTLRAGGTINELPTSWQYWQVCDEADLERRLAQYDRLYASIAEGGYTPQSEILREEATLKARTDEISVRVARDGRLLFQDGRHRLAIAKILPLPEVPVTITARHPIWVETRKRLEFVAHQHSGQLYHPLCHPDLANLPTAHGHERWDLIHAVLPPPPGLALDLGASFGYFSHRLESAGFDVVAVEVAETELTYLRLIRNATYRRFQVVSDSFLDLSGELHFDVVLALNIFHHFIRTQEQMARLRDFLGRLHTNVLIFEPHLPSEEPMQTSFLNPGPEEFARLVGEWTGLGSIRPLGEAADRRRLFVLRP